VSNTVRVAGKYGKRPPKRAAAIDAGPLLTGVVPEHPDAVDYIAAMNGGWKILGNDEAGDCAAVTWANVRRMVTKVLGGEEKYPSLEQVWEIYRTQNPDFDPNGDPEINGPGSSADGGMDLQTLLEHLVKVGGPDGVKAVCFARVNPKNHDEVMAAIAVFGYVWTGTMVLACNPQQFANDEPWDYDPASPIDGGHSIVTGGYGAAAPNASRALGGDEKFETWAAETSFTDAFWDHEVDECWAVVWPEHLGSKAFLEGVDQAQLRAAYKAITGHEFPNGDPAPAPADHKGLLEELASLVRDVAASGKKDVTELLAWLTSKGL
jgi:hypothetical protein